jgi:flagellar basal-body rod protein FlgB
MDFSSIPLFSVMKEKLGYLSERQAVLAQNIANADTPGYKAMDVVEPDFARLVKGQSVGQSLKMTITSPGHIGHGVGAIGEFATEKRKGTDELNPNGNNVSIEEEMAKAGLNQAEYQKVVGMYGKWITMFKVAIGNPNSGS